MVGNKKNGTGIMPLEITGDNTHMNLAFRICLEGESLRLSSVILQIILINMIRFTRMKSDKVYESWHMLIAP
jgi:hypothetical protein